MTNLSDSFLDKLKDRLPLSQVVGARLSLEKAGREYKACCPFHDEKTPSFYVNDQKQFYHCFGCGAHGDVISFVQEYDNLNFIEAVERLADKAGMQMPKPSPEMAEKQSRHDTFRDIMRAATDWCHDQLTGYTGRDALRYLTERGMDRATIDEFKIGYAPDDWDAMRDHLTGQGYKVDDLTTLGLVKQGKREDPYVFFRGRIMFPVTDRRGRVVAFGGRIIPDLADDKTPKYLNSPDHPLFHKGKLLFNMHRARANAGADQPVVVVEGYTDVSALHQAGVNASVAPLGTAVTDHQVEAVWNLNPKSTPPVYCFDGDAAGKKAAYRTIDRMLGQITPTQTAKFVFLPSGEDPDSFITANGKAAFVELVDNAMPLVNVLWQREVEGRSFNNPEAKAAVKERLVQATREIQHRDVQKLYQRMLTDRFYSEIYFDGRNNKQTSSGRGRRPSGKSIPAPISNNKKNTRRAEMVLAALINHPALIREYQDRLVNFAIADDELSAIRDTMVDHGGDWQDHLAKSPSERAGQIRRSNYLWFAGFAKKQAEVEEVRKGLNHTFGVTQAESIRRDITMAGKNLSDNMTEDELSRLTALQREEYLEQERDLD